MASVMTVESYDQQKAVDQTVLLSDLSHQLEEARVQIDQLKSSIRELRLQVNRSEGARDAMKEMFLELMQRPKG